MELWDLIDFIKAELHAAKCYAKRYVYYKRTKPQWSNWFKNMAMQELSHADTLRTIAEDMSNTGEVTEEGKKFLNKAVDELTDKSAVINAMLNS